MSYRDLTQVRVLTPAESVQIRYPNIAYTDSYANDPIRFTPDQRFVTPTIIDYSGELLNQASRDYADFLQFDINQSGSTEYLSMQMITPIFNRSQYIRIIGPRAQFTQFGV